MLVWRGVAVLHGVCVLGAAVVLGVEPIGGCDGVGAGTSLTCFSRACLFPRESNQRGRGSIDQCGRSIGRLAGVEKATKRGDQGPRVGSALA